MSGNRFYWDIHHYIFILNLNKKPVIHMDLVENNEMTAISIYFHGKYINLIGECTYTVHTLHSPYFTIVLAQSYVCAMQPDASNCKFNAKDFQMAVYTPLYQHQSPPVRISGSVRYS